jgi:hypothetical protein
MLSDSVQDPYRWRSVSCALFPLVKRLTDLAVFLIEPHGFVVRDVFGITFDRLTALVDPPLIDGTSS